MKVSLAQAIEIYACALWSHYKKVAVLGARSREDACAQIGDNEGVNVWSQVASLVGQSSLRDVVWAQAKGGSRLCRAMSSFGKVCCGSFVQT